MTEAVRIVEVGPRDGLQNEALQLPTATKLELIRRIVTAGVHHVEVTSFVSPRWVPQLADHSDVLRGVQAVPGVGYSVLVPNLKGFEAAVAAGAREVAVFAAATETFSRRNINCTIDESFERFALILAAADRSGIRVRGYVSCAIACPYEGATPPRAVAEVTWRLLDFGCYEVSLGDTTGVGTPDSVLRMLEAVATVAPVGRLAGHFHDTFGMAIANVHASYRFGLRAFDSSVAGLGGCPYAKGASGNVATEDLVHLFQASGIDLGIDLGELARCGEWVSANLNRAYEARAGRAVLGSGQRS